MAVIEGYPVVEDPPQNDSRRWDCVYIKIDISESKRVIKEGEAFSTIPNPGQGATIYRVVDGVRRVMGYYI